MTPDQARAHLTQAFDRMRRGEGIHEQMRQDERDAGRRVVIPGDVPWLMAEDWDPTVVVSIDGKRVRLIAILAKRQGQGAFKRLVAAIQAAGLQPVIVAPTREMRATLKRWGWKERVTGSGITTEQLMYPRRA